MLKLSSLEKLFGSFTAVDKIDLSIEKGELFGFLGPNGAGKTTTIKMIAGLLSPSSGTILFNDLDAWINSIEFKMKIGYIPDQPFLYEKLSGREFLFFCGGLYHLSTSKTKDKIEEMIDKLKIGNWIDKRTEDYSQGMRQRIAIASAFIHEPELIIVDEPMVGLDPQSALQVKKLLLDESEKGITIFMSTHSLNVVEEICTDVGIINKGRIIFRDKIDALHELKEQKNSNLENLFIQLTENE